MKLFLFHHAGGDKYAFRNFISYLDPKIEAMPIEVSGRGDRFNEPLINNIEDLVLDIFSQIKNNLDAPFAFLGVSMGALLSYLLCEKMQDEGLKLPQHLFLFSRRCPYSYQNYQKIAHCPSEEFWNGIIQYGGCPQALIDHPELKEIFEPILRNDFKLLENYQPKENPNKINAAATVLYGLADRISSEEAHSWSKLFEKSTEVIPFEGAHFFMFENPGLCIDIINDKLCEKK
ncbi:MAG: thioesterase [Bacteroidetes bacterium]|nr:thioesterase [Bacteroidota bacterium]